GRCGHHNADHLKYCFSCGRQLAVATAPDDRSATAPDPRDDAGQQQGDPSAPGGPGRGQDARDGGDWPSADRTGETALARTVAVKRRVRAGASPDRLAGGEPTLSGRLDLPRRAWESVRYVFTYARGRLDAETRKRQLMSERDGAQRLAESVLFGLGQIIVTEGETPTELADLKEHIARARLRREAAISDAIAAESLQASQDLRLGLEQSRAETECKACEHGALELDRSLRNLEDQRREIDNELQHGSAANTQRDSIGGTGDATGATDRASVLGEQRTLIDERYQSLRERAAALRASTVAARSKFEHATASRRQAALEMAACLSAHARDRAEAEQTTRELTVELGRTAHRMGLPRPSLVPGYAQVARLEKTIEERDHQLTSVQRAAGSYDRRKLALGLTVVATTLGLLATLATTAWFVLH
ncbi:MAG: hypothetical protein ABJA82_17805, partial [Myxococcales bacterium]